MPVSRAEVTRAILASRAIGIIRTDAAERAVDLAEVVIGAGLPTVEVSLTTPGALDAIAALASKHDGRIIGAGTIVDASQAKAALKAGARFLVSPALDRDVIAAAHDADAAAVPGCLTPTEIVAATRYGAELVKIFPADTVGVGHISAVRQALPDVRLVPTGGVTVQSAPRWLAAGAAAVALGSDLTNGSDSAVGDKVRALVRLIADASP